MPQATKASQSQKGNGNQTQPERKVVVPAEYVHTAKELEFRRSRIMVEINANRTFLRMLDTAGALDENEGAWLDTFYPAKKKKQPRSEEEIAATKALKKVAREEIAVEMGEDVPETEDEDEDEDED